MNVKCTYSAKFWPLIRQMQISGISDMDLKKFLVDNFENADLVYNELNGGVNTDSAILPMEAEDSTQEKFQEPTLTRTVVDNLDKTIHNYYTEENSSRNYQQLIRKFKSSIIADSVYDVTTNTSVNAEAKLSNGRTILNDNILNQKIELVNNIHEFLGLDQINPNDIIGDQEFNNIINNALEQFAIEYEIASDKAKFSEIIDSFTTLKYYDDLLKTHAPFISKKNAYGKTNGINMYIYNGPTAQLSSGWGNKKEMADASEETSDLARLLLESMPEATEDDRIIEGSSVGLNGFNSVMTSVKLALFNGDKAWDNLRTQYNEGVGFDIVEAISLYLDQLEVGSKLSPESANFQSGKLRAIRKFIFESEMADELKDMFRNMFFKTFAVQYRAYRNGPNGMYSYNLREQLADTQTRNIIDLLKSRIYTLHNNKKLRDEIFRDNNITISGTTITISTNDGDLTISTPQQDRGNVKPFIVTGSINNDKLNELLANVVNFIVPSEYIDVALQFNKKWNSIDDFASLLGITILGASGNPFVQIPNQKLPNLQPFKNHFVNLGKVMSVVYGANATNVVKNIKGNNVPLFQLATLAQNYESIRNRANELEQQAESQNRESMYKSNLLLSNNIAGNVVVRSDVSTSFDSIKSPSELIMSEVMSLSIVHDFYHNLYREGGDGTIYLQNTTFADKNMHTLVPYKLHQTVSAAGRQMNLYEEFTKIIQTGNSDAITDLIIELRKRKVSAAVKNVLDDYNQVFGEKFTRLEQVDKFLKDNKYNAETLQNAFTKSGVTLRENIHYTKNLQKGGSWGIATNETMKNLFNVFTDPAKAKARLQREKEMFAKHLVDNKFELNINEDKVIADLGSRISGWVNEDGIIEIMRNGKLNPVFESYFMADVLLSNEYNSLMAGETWAHANKNKAGDTDEEYMYFSESNRLIAQFKRNVIYGASHHSFLQGMKYGVAKVIDVAVINDTNTELYNIVGDIHKGEPMDGSGICSPLQSILENNSLVDSRVGWDKKTIMHDIDVQTGQPTLLKWAVYALTNERRRMSWGSDISADRLYKKMHNKPLSKQFSISNYFKSYGEDIFYKDPNSGKIFKILEIYDASNGVIIHIQEVDEFGELVGERIVTEYQPKTLYDLDSIFGGAWGMKFDDKLNKFIYADHNLNLLTKIVCEEDLKDKFIAYVTNKSAIKVGAANINESNKFYNDDDLTTFSMSSRFGGVQMDADHELDESIVTEMTQMISALNQNGYTHEIANMIYQDIGKAVLEALGGINAAINSSDSNKLYDILAKLFIESFANGEKDTIGLAQAFINLAEKSLQESGITYKIPFSAASIHGKFTSTVTSTLTRKGIRRKYAGVAAVLSPSHGMIQYFNYNNQNVTFEELAKIVYDNGESWNDIINNNGILADGTWSKFVPEINHDDIDGQDHIVVCNQDGSIAMVDSVDKNGMKTTKPLFDKKIKTWEDYDYIKNKLYNSKYTFRVRSLSPRDLKGSKTTFNLQIVNNITGESELRQFDTRQLDTVRASLYLKKKTQTEYEKDFIKSVVGETKGKSKSGILSDLQKRTQNTLYRLSHELPLEQNVLFGISANVTNQYIPINTIVHPAEMVLGKMNMTKYGLQNGDTLNSVLSQGNKFFLKRMVSNYSRPDVDREFYDLVLYTGSGEKVLIKIGNKDDFQRSHNVKISKQGDSFNIVDDEVYYNDILLSNSYDKQFGTYTDDIGNTHDIIFIDNITQLREFSKSEIFDSYRFNFTENNYRDLAKYRFAKDIAAGKQINFKYKTDNNKEIQTVYDENAHEVYKLLQANEDYLFTNKLTKLSKQKFESFKKQLNFVGARIPTQGMQSFQPLRVVAFTDAPGNSVYVNADQLWLQGSDLDIDKVYLMGYDPDDNGVIKSLSNLSKTVISDEVDRLERPNGVRYTEGEYGLEISYSELQAVLNMQKRNSYKIGNIRLSTVFNKILKSNDAIITFAQPMEIGQLETFEEDKRKFLQMLNDHSLTQLSDHIREKALKNQIVSSILQVVTNPVNQINLTIPINMEEQQEIAATSVLGKAEKTMTMDDPSVKFIMQQQNMVGKTCIGSTAVSLKVFFGLTNYYNNEYRKLINVANTGNAADLMSAIDRLVFSIVGQKASSQRNIGAITNLNLMYVIDRISQLNNPEFNDAIDWLLQIHEYSNSTDAALNLSGLISAATDNAKELILSKINATPKLIDMYSYLMITGKSFKEASEIMMSQTFNDIIKFVEPNMFNSRTKHYSLDYALSLFGFEGTGIAPEGLLRHEIDIKIIENFRKKVPIGSLYYILENNSLIIDLIEKQKEIIRLLSTTTTSLNEEFDEDAYYDQSQDDQIQEDEIVYNDDYNDSFNDNKRNYDTSPPTIKERIQFINYLKDCLERNQLIQNSPKQKRIEIIDTLTLDLVWAVKEMKTLGRMFGINQGIRTNSAEKYAYIKNIENHVNAMVARNSKSLYVEKRKAISKINEKFELMSFLRDEGYRNRWIGYYNGIKARFNILDIITKIPHFAEMFKLLYVDNVLINSHSIKSRLQERFEEELGLPGDKKLSNKEYILLGHFANNVLISNWLFGQNLEFTINKGQFYYTYGTKGYELSEDQKTIQLNNPQGIATFKRWVEDAVIPRLQKSQDDGITDYSDNEFVKSLIPFAQQDNKLKQIKNQYRFPINMKQTDVTQKTQIKYEQISTDFNKIAHNTLENGWTIGDIFYLYNLIVNKDAIGQNALTKLFEDMVTTGNPNTIVLNFYDWLSDVDKNGTELHYSIDDLRLMMASQSSKDRIGMGINNGEVSYRDSNQIKQVQTMANPDFTLGMIGIDKDVIMQAGTSISNTIREAKINYQYKQQINSQEAINAIASKFLSNYNGGFELLNSRELQNERDERSRNAKAFIHNGMVAINIDKADISTPLHEYIHIVLGGLKNQNPEIYYHLVSLITEHPKYNEMSRLRIYDGLFGSDLREEIFVTLMGDYLRNRIYEWNGNKEFKSATDAIHEVLDNLFEIDTKNVELSDLLETPIDKIFEVFGSQLFVNDFSPIMDWTVVQLNQQLSALKDELVIEELLKEDCK